MFKGYGEGFRITVSFIFMFIFQHFFFRTKRPLSALEERSHKMLSEFRKVSLAGFPMQLFFN